MSPFPLPSRLLRLTLPPPPFPSLQIPPDQYAARFEAAMDSYFVACPDKFTLPLSSSKTTTKVAKSSIPSIF